MQTPAGDVRTCGMPATSYGDEIKVQDELLLHASMLVGSLAPCSPSNRLRSLPRRGRGSRTWFMSGSRRPSEPAFAPGQELREHELAAQLGVSRTPVREAIWRLADAGLLVVQPQVGTRVARIHLSAVREAQFARQALEVAALEAVCAARSATSPASEAASRSRQPPRKRETSTGSSPRTTRCTPRSSGWPASPALGPGLAGEGGPRPAPAAQCTRRRHHRGAHRRARRDRRPRRSGRRTEQPRCSRRHAARILDLQPDLVAAHPDYFAD